MITGQMNDAQWNHLMTIGRMHNHICGNSQEQSSLNEYVIKHEEELAHVMIVETLMENVELTPEFIAENKEYVSAVHRIVKKIEKEEQQSLRSIIRLDRFLELVKEE